MKTNTNTFTNRAMAIVIAVMLMVMTFVSAIPVSAASRLDTTETVSFTANCDKSGYTFTVYKVANLVSTTTSPYETKYESLVPQIKDSVLSGDTASVLSALDSVTQMPDTATVVGTYCSDDADTVTFDNLEQGIYYVKATNYPAGVKAVTNSVFALPYFNNNEWQYTIPDIELASKVADGTATTEKTITNSTKNNVNYTDVSLGDTVDFEIRSTTAGSTSMKLSAYTVYDDMSAGLTLNEDSFNVALLKADGSKISDLKTSDYEVTVTSSGEGKNTLFNVSLTNTFLQTDALYASDVYYTSVTYSATLNKYAVVGTAGNPNEEVKLEYANKNGVTSEVDGNTVYVYTYAVQTVKVDEDKKPLEGAEFALYTTEEIEKEKADEHYSPVAIATGTSDKNGLVKYYNDKKEEIRLQSGTYYIEETKAPKGYALNGNLIEITIDATYGDTFTNGTYVTNCSENGIASIDMTNYPIVLPVTGGVGTTIFFVLSGISALGGVALLTVYLKKRRTVKSN